MIRQAKFGDIPALAALMDEMYRRSKYRDRDEIDMKSAKALVMQCIQRHGMQRAGGSSVFVIDRDGKIDGFIIGLLEPIYHIGKKLTATDLFYYAREKARPQDALRLFDQFIAWAESIPDVIEIRNGATDAIGDYRRVEALYRRKGLAQSGVIYERSVPCRVP